MKIALAALTFVALALLGVAAQATPQELAEVPSFTATLLKSGISLAAVCLAAVLVIKLVLPRLQRRPAADGPSLQLLQSLPVGPRRSILLLRAVDRILVVGASEAGMHPLAEIAAPDGSSAEFEAALQKLQAPPPDREPHA